MTSSSDLDWTRSTLSHGDRAVEFARDTDGGTAVRVADDPARVLVFTTDEIRAFLGGAVAGEFDRFGGPATDGTPLSPLSDLRLRDLRQPDEGQA